MSAATSEAITAAPSSAVTSPTPPEIEYRRCPCLSALPGRACPACGGSKWLRRCDDCHGSGHIYANRRYSAGGQQPTSEKHGRCNGRGWLPCTHEEARLLDEQMAEQATRARAQAASKSAPAATK
jgi:hypothetical protein